MSSETCHITNQDSLAGGEKEGEASEQAQKCATSQTRTHLLEGSEQVGKLGNVAYHK
jgi:hypothetical protein